MWQVLTGDCRRLMAGMADCSVDSVVCDPPYELGFMGKKWDSTGIAFEVAMWAECLRVLKPGGHLVSFGGQRTIHRITCAIEDAGFDVRDSCAWQYFSGFPKSLDVSKAIDAAAGAVREVVGMKSDPRYLSPRTNSPNHMDRQAGVAGGHGAENAAAQITAPATADAKKWQGWGTALKPCLEPWVLCRKPFKGTVAANVLRWGTGALNIDGCRYAYGDRAWPGPNDKAHDGAKYSGKGGRRTYGAFAADEVGMEATAHPKGRWPANVYVCPKPSTAEREIGCGHLARATAGELTDRAEGSDGLQSPRAGAGRTSSGRGNTHPTVKPIALMQWLCRLVTPPGGLVLDPFAGSGTTGIAAVREGFAFVGCEMDPAHVVIARARIIGDAPLFNSMQEARAPAR